MPESPETSSNCSCALSAVPPEEPQITDTDGNEMKGLIGPFNEGDELRLVCTTNGGNL